MLSSWLVALLGAISLAGGAIHARHDNYRRLALFFLLAIIPVTLILLYTAQWPTHDLVRQPRCHSTFWEVKCPV